LERESKQDRRWSVRLMFRVRNLRRRLAKFIEPSGPDSDTRWDLPIDFSLKGAAALREFVPIDEEGYLVVAAPAWGDSRAYVLYTALDEVKKSAIYLMRLREHLDGPPMSPREDRISRLLFTHVLEEESGRERRLLEVLVTLVLFTTTDDQPYYRDLLLLEQLDDALAVNTDLAEFHGAESANVNESIDHWFEQIRNNEEKIDLAKAWHRKSQTPLPKRQKLRPGNLLSSVRKRIKSAIPLMTDHEKLVFGLSYAGYSGASESIHYSVNAGYKSYKVRYLAEKPKPGIQEDWFPARYVRRLYARAQFTEQLESMMSEGEMPPEVGSFSTEQVQSILRAALTETWHQGLRDCVRSRQRQ